MAKPSFVPDVGLLELFLRFLRFGCLAWGGPVAQIAMIRQELVEEEQWVSREQFNRALAVYQALPGPEAHELCVYFGMVARGRVGAFLAGLGFMLPGFLLMLALSWAYVRFGLGSPVIAAAFTAVQAAVAALVLRAVHHIGRHAISDRWLAGIAGTAFLSQLAGVPFAVPLIVGGTAYVVSRRFKGAFAAVLLLSTVGVSVALLLQSPAAFLPEAPSASAPSQEPGLAQLSITGLRAGLLTFGGAYTAIPFVQKDAVFTGGWMTNQQFLDGLALSGVLPAPFIIFATFVGYLGGGVMGALVLTAGIFAPAFLFTMVGHGFFERLVRQLMIHRFLDGVTAAVVGLIAATSVGLLWSSLRTPMGVGVFVLSCVILYRWKSKAATPVVVLTAGLVGLALWAAGAP